VIGLRWHYFTDTVAGAAVGIATVCGLTLIIDGVWGLSHGPLLLPRPPSAREAPSVPALDPFTERPGWIGLTSLTIRRQNVLARHRDRRGTVMTNVAGAGMKIADSRVVSGPQSPQSSARPAGARYMSLCAMRPGAGLVSAPGVTN